MKKRRPNSALSQKKVNKKTRYEAAWFVTFSCGPFTPPCHQRWDATERLKMQFAKKKKKKKNTPNCKPLDMKTL